MLLTTLGFEIRKCYELSEYFQAMNMPYTVFLKAKFDFVGVHIILFILAINTADAC